LTRTGVCEDHGVGVDLVTDNQRTANFAGHTLVNFYTTLFGTSRIVALCNVLAIEQGRGKVVRRAVDVVANKTSDKNDTVMKVDDVKNDVVSQQQENVVTVSKTTPTIASIETSKTVDATGKLFKSSLSCKNENFELQKMVD